jgi:orotate phosphoribosyltransferase
MKNTKAVQEKFGPMIAKKAFEMEAIKLSTTDPFRWASGYRMPIYNDNRRLLADSSARKLIAEGFYALVEELNLTFGSIAGTATAGIPHATTLSDMMQLPLLYVRSAGKDHGMKNQIEGVGPKHSIKGESVLLIEDLISTGGSSIKAINALREQEALVSYCLSIFTYNLQASIDAFDQLSPPCANISLLDYDTMLSTAVEQGYLDETSLSLLREWREDPFNWGAKNNFL